MNIVQALQSDTTHGGIRVSCGSRWLYWTDVDAWVVLERRPYQKQNRTIYTGTSEEQAVKHLAED